MRVWYIESRLRRRGEQWSDWSILHNLDEVFTQQEIAQKYCDQANEDEGKDRESNDTHYHDQHNRSVLLEAEYQVHPYTLTREEGLVLEVTKEE